MLGLWSVVTLVLTAGLPVCHVLTMQWAILLISLRVATPDHRSDRPQVGELSMLSWSLRGEPMPPIEGGQSLAEAEPNPKRGPIFIAAISIDPGTI
jgi:hypothetical protein